MDVCKGVVFSQRYLYDLSKLSITSKLQCKKWEVGSDKFDSNRSVHGIRAPKQLEF